MKIQTNQLIGVALDWAVAKCEDKPITLRSVSAMGSKVDTFVSVGERDEFGILAYIPSADWSQGGPIIERENIDIEHYTPHAEPKYCIAWMRHPYKGRGSTALTAAMRCYVASKLGDEVEVPDELIA